MTLDKHTIQGLAAFTTKTLPSSEFEKRMLNAGYYEVGTAPAQGGRVKTAAVSIPDRELMKFQPSSVLVLNLPNGHVSIPKRVFINKT